MKVLRSFAVVPRLFAVTMAAFLSLVPTGCVHRTMQQKPATMTSPGIVILNHDQIESKDKIAKALAQVAEDYRTNTDQGNLAQAKILRNRFVFTIMGQIEASYGNFEHSFRSNRATAETATDAAVLGLTAAASVVGEAGIKDMLTAAVGAATGTRLSAEKNFFNDEGTIALLTQMRASRTTIEAQIIKRCANDVTQYSLEEAWKDLNRYVNAGSIESAMIQLAANAGNQNTVAQKQVSDAIDSVTTPSTAQDVIDGKKMRAIAASLITAIQPAGDAAPDPDTQKKAADAIATILANAGNPPPAETDPVTLVGLLKAEMLAAFHDPALNTRLLGAMTLAPAQFGGKGQ